MRLRICFVVITLFLITSIPVRAEETLTLDVRVGFDAFYKTNAWTPVWVTVANQGANLQAELRVRDDQVGFNASNILYVYPVDLPGQSRKQFTLYVPLRGQRRLTIDLVDNEGNLLLTQHSNIEALSEGAFLVGVVASDSSLLNGLAKFKTAGDERVAVAHLKLDNLPPIPKVWDGLDMLVFNDVDTTRLTPRQRDILDNWVRRGGRLVTGGGPNARQTIAGLMSLLPFANIINQTLPHPLFALDSFAQIRLEDRGPYVAAAPTNVTGRVMVKEGTWPLVVSQERGLGRVHYIAFDLGLAPLDTLSGESQFFPQLTGQFQPPPKDFLDKAGTRNMRSSLALIPDQTLPTPGTVAIYLIIYVLVLGPANYFILSRMKRREWAWFSIPIIIILFSAYGYFSGFRLRGGRALVRQIAVIRAEVGAPLADIDTFVGVYSPFRADYALEIDAETTVLVQSLPDNYGLHNELTVTSGHPTTIENLRSDIGGMPGIMVYSHIASPQITANLSYSRADHRISGYLVNNTGRPITYAQLVVEGAVLHLGALPSGKTQIDDIVSDLDTFGRFYRSIDPGDNPREILKLAGRDTAVKTILGLNNGVHSRPDFAGLHLVGWQDGSPMQVELTNTNGDKMDETLLVVGLPVVVN